MSADTSSAIIQLGRPFYVALLILATVAVALAYVARTSYARQIAAAVIRATIHLSLLGLVIAAIISSLALSALFIVVIAVVSSYTAASRTLGRRPSARAVALSGSAVAAPALTVVLSLVAAGVVPSRGIAIIPIAGIVMGGAMTASGLAGKRARESIGNRWGEVEAGVALGLPPRFIRWEVCQGAAETGILPHLDQTRTVGLVSIPGAFVGMVLGGASPTAAAAMQLLVLFCILCCGSIAALVTCRYVAAGWFGDFRPNR